MEEKQSKEERTRTLSFIRIYCHLVKYRDTVNISYEDHPDKISIIQFLCQNLPDLLQYQFIPVTMRGPSLKDALNCLLCFAERDIDYIEITDSIQIGEEKHLVKVLTQGVSESANRHFSKMTVLWRIFANVELTRVGDSFTLEASDGLFRTVAVQPKVTRNDILMRFHEFIQYKMPSDFWKRMHDTILKGCKFKVDNSPDIMTRIGKNMLNLSRGLDEHWLKIALFLIGRGIMMYGRFAVEKGDGGKAKPLDRSDFSKLGMALSVYIIENNCWNIDIIEGKPLLYTKSVGDNAGRLRNFSLLFALATSNPGSIHDDEVFFKEMENKIYVFGSNYFLSLKNE